MVMSRLMQFAGGHVQGEGELAVMTEGVARLVNRVG